MQYIIGTMVSLFFFVSVQAMNETDDSTLLRKQAILKNAQKSMRPQELEFLLMLDFQKKEAAKADVEALNELNDIISKVEEDTDEIISEDIKDIIERRNTSQSRPMLTKEIESVS